jgi:hypothetical protein
MVGHTYRPEVHACRAGDPMQQVAQQMSKHGVGVLAICDDSRLAGVISGHNGPVRTSPQTALRFGSGLLILPGSGSGSAWEKMPTTLLYTVKGHKTR